MKAKEWLKVAPRGAARQLCETLGINRAAFYHLSAGIRKPGLEMAVKLAEESHRMTGEGMTIAALVGIDHLPEHLILGKRAEKKG